MAITEVDLKKPTPIIYQDVKFKNQALTGGVPSDYDFDLEDELPETRAGIFFSDAVRNTVAIAMRKTTITKILDKDQRIEIAIPAPTSNNSTLNTSYLQLKEKYEAEVKSNPIRNRTWDDMFEVLAIELSKIRFETSAVEITPRNSIKFTFALGDSKLLMVTKSFSKLEDENSNTIIFSIFIDHELIVSDASELTEFVKGITKYLTV